MWSCYKREVQLDEGNGRLECAPAGTKIPRNLNFHETELSLAYRVNKGTQSSETSLFLLNQNSTWRETQLLCFFSILVGLSTIS